MVDIVVKTQLNLTKNIYLEYSCDNGRYEIREDQWLEITTGKMVFFDGNYSKKDFLDRVEELINLFKNGDYNVFIDGEDVTSHF